MRAKSRSNYSVTYMSDWHLGVVFHHYNPISFIFNHPFKLVHILCHVIQATWIHNPIILTVHKFVANHDKSDFLFKLLGTWCRCFYINCLIIFFNCKRCVEATFFFTVIVHEGDYITFHLRRLAMFSKVPFLTAFVASIFLTMIFPVRIMSTKHKRGGELCF